MRWIDTERERERETHTHIETPIPTDPDDAGAEDCLDIAGAGELESALGDAIVPSLLKVKILPLRGVGVFTWRDALFLIFGASSCNRKTRRDTDGMLTDRDLFNL